MRVDGVISVGLDRRRRPDRPRRRPAGAQQPGQLPDGLQAAAAGVRRGHPRRPRHGLGRAARLAHHRLSSSNVWSRVRRARARSRTSARSSVLILILLSDRKAYWVSKADRIRVTPHGLRQHHRRCVLRSPRTAGDRLRPGRDRPQHPVRLHRPAQLRPGRLHGRSAPSASRSASSTYGPPVLGRHGHRAWSLPLVLALILGVPTLRLRADYLAIATIAASEILRLVFGSVEIKRHFGGSNGLTGYRRHVLRPQPVRRPASTSASPASRPRRPVGDDGRLDARRLWLPAGLGC